MADPFPKSKQLARGERRYRRKVASPKQWQAIWEAKISGMSCRVCLDNYGPMEAHHLLSRAALGDDVVDNIVPLCAMCHASVTTRDYVALRVLHERLLVKEKAYLVEKIGGAMPRLFGV
jgi:5-methylcytosine-specific restriction endonuclease McrA